MRSRILFLLLWAFTLTGMGLSFWVVNKLENNAKSSSRALSVLVSNLLISSLSNEEIYETLHRVIADIDFPVAIVDNTGKVRAYKNVDESEIKSLPFKENITYYGRKMGVLLYGYPPYVRWLRWINLFLFLGILIISLTFFYTAYIVERYEYSEFWAGFAKGLAHQLATPISSLLGWYEVVKDRLPVEAREGIEKDLNYLTSVLRRFSKLGGQVELVDLDLKEVIGKTVKNLKLRYRNVDISLDLEKVSVKGDSELIGWALENFVKNSVEAGATKVKVSVKRKGKRVCIYVEDNGKGFDKEGKKKAFKESFSTKQRGWGVGLTLVRKIAQIHKGEAFIVESEPFYKTVVALCIPSA